MDPSTQKCANSDPEGKDELQDELNLDPEQLSELHSRWKEVEWILRTSTITKRIEPVIDERERIWNEAAKKVKAENERLKASREAQAQAQQEEQTIANPEPEIVVEPFEPAELERRWREVLAISGDFTQEASRRIAELKAEVADKESMVAQREEVVASIDDQARALKDELDSIDKAIEEAVEDLRSHELPQFWRF